MTDHKILGLDIENSGCLAWVWDTGRQFVGIDQIERDWHILCWCAKWLDTDEVMWDSVWRQVGPEGDLTDDRAVVENLAGLIEQADMVYGHNVINFDIRKVKARMMCHEMAPLPPLQVFDTYKQMSRVSRHASHKLDYLSQQLLGENKIKTDRELWTRCEHGDPKAWRDMVDYCARDVQLTEEIYLRLRPWADRHPNLSLLAADGVPRCTRCDSDDLVRDGYYFTTVSVFQRWRCRDCGNRRNRSRISSLEKWQKEGLLTNAG